MNVALGAVAFVKSDRSVGYLRLSIKEVKMHRRNSVAGRKKNLITKGFAVPIHSLPCSTQVF